MIAPMVGVSATLVTSFMALLLLLVVKGIAAGGSVPSAADATLPDDMEEFPPCSREFVGRVFSLDDSQFVSSMKSPALEKLFCSERKAVALLWVRQTSAAVQQTMREHRLIARSSEDLEFSTEVKLLLLYAELMCICGVLFVAIQSAGPLWLRSLALHVEVHAQHLAEVQQSFQAATTPRELPRVGAL